MAIPAPRIFADRNIGARGKGGRLAAAGAH
jgi:hypothetical protein